MPDGRTSTVRAPLLRFDTRRFGFLGRASIGSPPPDAGLLALAFDAPGGGDSDSDSDALAPLGAAQVLALFCANEPLPAGSKVAPRLVGRFGHSINDAGIAMLCDEPVKRLSWVFGPDTIAGFLTKTPAEAMLSVGFSKTWLSHRIEDKTTHSLLLFECPENERVLATWDNVMALIKEHYGDDIYERLKPFVFDLKTTHIKDIDPKGRLRYIYELPMIEKVFHPEFYSPERFCAKKLESLSLYDARGFLYHTIGCSYLFFGKGHSRDPNGEDKFEYLVPNQRISSIPNYAMEKVEISATDLVGIYGGKILNKKERCELIAKMFRDNEAIQPDSMLTEGIVGRFVAGTRNEDFERLAGESVNEVAFVFGGDTIRTFCGMSASKALISLGFTKETLVSMSKSNFKHKLILFPEPSLCRQAKWHHVMEMVLDCYGQDVHRKLLPHLTDLKLTDYKDIDPHQRLIEIASLPHHEKMKHPEFYSPSKIRKISNVSLYDVKRLREVFFYHSMRCNPLFEGLGYTRSRNGDDDRAEYLVRNHKISELVDAVVVDVEFYENELV